MDNAVLVLALLTQKPLRTQGLHFSHRSASGTLFFPFWLVFLCLSVLATICFVCGYVLVVRRRRRIIGMIFSSPEFSLLEDYDNIPSDSDWTNVALLPSTNGINEQTTRKNGLRTPRTPQRSNRPTSRESPWKQLLAKSPLED
ncbi:unnamed protein product, partial [Cylicocyclus nassatus]